ncbi:MAG: DNA replication and repair protein RecF [Acidobacteriota bacterium]
MLTRLTLANFRNLDDTIWEPGPGPHLILGPNGAGKTSLLESVYVVATTRSFRTPRLTECSSHGRSDFLICAEVDRNRRSRLTVGLAATGMHRSVNEAGTPLMEHLRVQPVVAWTATEGSLLTGAPEGRRRFIDQGIVSARPAALDVLARYRRALAQKRQLLADRESGLKAWNEVVAREASALMELRKDYLSDLSEQLAAVVTDLDLELPTIHLRYRPSISRDTDAEAVFEELERVREQERSEARPLLGPHRDEMEIRWGRHPIKSVGSAGERKVLGLLISAARGRVLAAADREPIYLLDDADSELDTERLEAIWSLFRDSGQVFVSSNRPNAWKADSTTTRWVLKSGSISPD